MRGRWTALSLALALTLTLTACGAKNENEPATGRMSDRGTSGTEASLRRARELMADGRYYAGTDGAVTRREEKGETEWEKLGRQLRESWDKLMDGAEDTARDVGRGVENAARAGEHQTGAKTGTT